MEADNLKASFWDFKGAVDYVDTWLFMGSPFPMLLILAFYLFFVLRCGPKFMADRPAYKLRKTLIVYNACQVAFSAYIFYLGANIIYDAGLTEDTCTLDNKPMKYRIISGTHVYFLAKMSELLDTIFFVLRKKWNQVSFLHVYHHFIMYAATWVQLKYEPTYSVIFLGTINGFVHIIMYSYYCLSAFPGLSKHLWWKKYITKMQLIQFFLIWIQVTWNFNVSPCPPSYIILFISWAHIILFTYLFSDFYVKSFIHKKKDDKAQVKRKSDYRNGADVKIDDKNYRIFLKFLNIPFLGIRNLKENMKLL